MWASRLAALTREEFAAVVGCCATVDSGCVSAHLKMEAGSSGGGVIPVTSSSASASPGGQLHPVPPHAAAIRGASASSAVSALSVLTPPATREVSSTGVALLHQELLLYALRRGGAAAAEGGLDGAQREGPAGGLSLHDGKSLSGEEGERVSAQPAEQTLSLTSRVLGAASEAAAGTLQSCGFRVGARVAERLTLKCSRMPEQRECVKFVCKDLWHFLFQKQADRLQTNRRGGYVIHDSALPWLRRLGTPTETAASAADAPVVSSSAASTAVLGGRPSGLCLEADAGGEALDAALLSLADTQPHLHVAFVCGVIRGALAALGLVCSVVAEAPRPPSCAFQIRIPSS